MRDGGEDLPPELMEKPPFRGWKENRRFFWGMFFGGSKRETKTWKVVCCWVNNQGCEGKENAEDAEEEEMVSVRF